MWIEHTLNKQHAKYKLSWFFSSSHSLESLYVSFTPFNWTDNRCYSVVFTLPFIIFLHVVVVVVVFFSAFQRYVRSFCVLLLSFRVRRVYGSDSINIYSENLSIQSSLVDVGLLLNVDWLKKKEWIYRKTASNNAQVYIKNSNITPSKKNQFKIFHLCTWYFLVNKDSLKFHQSKDQT